LRDFHLEIARIFSRKGWLGLYCLELSGKPVAVLYGFKYMSKYYAYITGMDPAYNQFGVGNLLFLNVMAKCIENGLSEFDFIWGTDDYKWHWNATAKRNYKAIIPRMGALSNMKLFLYEQYWSQGNRIKFFQKKVFRERK
jgi:CelD/BcsL family acetyltransferase involved in cellulose biosynthesis